MPELPDVEVLKRYLDATSLHHTITGVEVRAERVLHHVSPQELGSQLQNQAFESTRRHGKHLFVRLDGGGWLRLHFGMTGDLKYLKEGEPDYTQVRFDFANGYHLAYVMPRKLGQIEPVEGVESFVKRKELGPDALELDRESFRELLSGRRGMIKSTLMNQSVMAGIGNVYSDEILFQAQVYPRHKVRQLDQQTLEAIGETTQAVLHTAIENQAQPERLPDSYLITHRSPAAGCPRCGGKVERIEVAGRAGYYCPDCQSE